MSEDQNESWLPEPDLTGDNSQNKTPEHRSDLVPIEEIKRRLKSRYGLEEDEMNVLYPTEEKLREFYKKVCLQLGEVGNTVEDEDAPEDTYVPNQTEKLEAESIKINEEREKERIKDEKEKKKQSKEKKAFEAAPQDHLKPDEKVSYADWLKAKKALYDETQEGEEAD